MSGHNWGWGNSLPQRAVPREDIIFCYGYLNNLKYNYLDDSVNFLLQLGNVTLIKVPANVILKYVDICMSIFEIL